MEAARDKAVLMEELQLPGRSYVRSSVAVLKSRMLDAAFRL